MIQSRLLSVVHKPKWDLFHIYLGGIFLTTGFVGSAHFKKTDYKNNPCSSIIQSALVGGYVSLVWPLWIPSKSIYCISKYLFNQK